MPLLNNLPQVIDGPGEYATRAGKRVTVFSVDARGYSYAGGTETRFAAKGSPWVMFRGKLRPRGYDIWHLSGRHSVMTETPRDIVGRWEA